MRRAAKLAALPGGVNLSSLVIRFFWRVERVFPGVRNAVWRTFYNAVTRLIPDTNHHFMNWGYAPLNASDTTRPVQALDALHLSMTRLYAHTLGDVDVSGRRVLEVGSGRGGGASWIARSQETLSVLGVELSPVAVKYCKAVHGQVKGLGFSVGNALQLPLSEAQIDVVVNVESCHHYRDMPAFLSEVRRVLVPGGYFCVSDYREAAEIPQLEADLVASGLQILRSVDITANVLAALDADNAAKEAFLAGRFFGPVRAIFRTFFGNQGTDVYNGFATRQWVYRSWILQKPHPL